MITLILSSYGKVNNDLTDVSSAKKIRLGNIDHVQSQAHGILKILYWSLIQFLKTNKI